MFCQKCGTALEANADVCHSCNTKTQGMKFCQKCGDSLPADAKVCGSCSTPSSVQAAPIHWLSMGLFVIGFITFGILGGDYTLNEVNIFDYLTIPISIAAVIVAIITIPRYRRVLKIISIVLNVFLLVGSIGWVL